MDLAGGELGTRGGRVAVGGGAALGFHGHGRTGESLHGGERKGSSEAVSCAGSGTRSSVSLTPLN